MRMATHPTKRTLLPYPGTVTITYRLRVRETEKDLVESHMLGKPKETQGLIL